MRKWILLLMLVAFLPLALYAEGFFGGKLLYSDSLNAKLNRLLQEELQKRIPKDRSYRITFPLHMSTRHRLTEWIQCTIQLPTTKIENPQEALELFLPYARAYVDTINNVREARPYFMNFPFTLDMCDLLVDFARDPKTNMFYCDPFLSEVAWDGPTFNIFRMDKEKSGVYIDVYKTTNMPPESLQKLEIPHFDSKKVPTPIPEATKYSYFNDELEKEFDFYRKFAKQNGLLFLAWELVFNEKCRQSFKNRCMEAAFAAQEKYLTLEESKELASKTREAFIQFALPYVKIKNWANNYRERGEEVLTPHINLQEYMSFRISFWDQYIDRIKPPHIAEIWVTGTKARYYVSNELQQLQLVHEEDIPSYDMEIPVPENLLKKQPKES